MYILISTQHLLFVPVKEKLNFKKDSSNKFTEQKRNFGKLIPIKKRPEKKL